MTVQKINLLVLNGTGGINLFNFAVEFGIRLTFQSLSVVFDSDCDFP